MTLPKHPFRKDTRKYRTNKINRFIHGHNSKFIKRSEEGQRRVTESVTGERQWNWKGDNVKNSSLHEWLRKHLPQKEFCEICNQVPPQDVANLTGIYKRDFKNWGRLCTSCHMKYDNIIRNLS